ncbi:Uncharacterised protein [Vibrio cholerae]|nr:Uncharacterised protein [Vibrio cholerae]
MVRATVAEPCATRKQVAITNAATTTGIPVSDSTPASALPMPLARSTPPNMPPAPVTKITAQMGASESPHSFSRRAMP